MKLRMINPTEPEPEATDAEVAAGWAAQALAEGRYELGAALANIARNAARAERAAAHGARMVPMLGRTRDERPTEPERTPIHDEVSGPITHSDPEALARHVQGATFRDGETAVLASVGPTGNGNADVPDLAFPELAREAQTEIFGRPRELDLETPPHGRCVAVIQTAGPAGMANTAECHEVIIWNHGHVGDASTPAIRAGWHHLNPALDQHHAPVVQQG